MTVFEQIGQKLKMARESKGLSLGQIYDRTKISTANLEAIEAGDIDQLPEPVYVSGFIKRYAECVGLNGQNLTEEFRQASDDEEDRAEKSAFGGWGGKAVAVQQQPIVHSSLSKAKIAPPKPSIAKLVFYPAFLIVIIVGLISYLFYYQQQQFKAKDPSIVALEQSTSRFSPANVSTSDAESEDKSDSESATSEAKDAEKDSKVSLTASKHVWIEVRALSTGNSLFTGYLEAGDRRDYQDSQGLKIRAGNGGSLNVAFKGKNETFGPSGKPLTRSFVAKNASSSSSQVSSDTADAKPQAAPKPRKVVKVAPKPKPKPKPKKIMRTPSRYIPGESVGGTRSIGVPYRYTE